jgi:hypothetical protein
MGAWILLALRLCVDVSPDLHHEAHLHLRIDQAGGLSADQLQIAVDEVRKIWSAAGVRVTTGRYSDPVPADGATVSVRVVRVDMSKNGEPVLGWVTADVRARALPAIFISLIGLRGLLEATAYRNVPFSAQPATLRDRLMAQAVGRVAAHELGHYFLNSSRHDDHGLMRAAYSAVDLMTPLPRRFEIPAAGRDAVRLEVAALSTKQAAATGVPGR